MVEHRTLGFVESLGRKHFRMTDSIPLFQSSIYLKNMSTHRDFIVRNDAVVLPSVCWVCPGFFFF